MSGPGSSGSLPLKADSQEFQDTSLSSLNHSDGGVDCPSLLRLKNSTPQSDESLVVGIDLSTQSCKALAFDLASLRFAGEAQVIFDTELNQYGTANGCHAEAESGTCTTPVGVWIDALELCLRRLGDNLKKEGFSLRQVALVS